MIEKYKSLIFILTLFITTIIINLVTKSEHDKKVDKFLKEPYIKNCTKNSRFHQMM